MLRTGERLDDLQRNGWKIIQHEKMFCFGMDAVLLSSFAFAEKGDRVLDLGTGSGVIPILMRGKTLCTDFTGLEINPESADRAQRSVLLNDLGESIRIVCGDIRNVRELFDFASFDVVTANPPYMPKGGGKASEDDWKACARHETCCTLEDVAAGAAWALKERGRFFLVHRPFRLPGIIRTLSRFRLEPKRMQMVCPFADTKPNLVLIEAVKGAGEYLINEPPLIVYRSPGEYTDRVLEMYGRLS